MCIRVDDGVCPVYLDVAQVHRQRCVLFPLLFNSFKAVLQVAAKRVRAGADVVADLMTLKTRTEEAAKGGGAKDRRG